MELRTRPVCGYREPEPPRDPKLRIACVVRRDTKETIVGRADCPSCGAIWDEYVNKKTGAVKTEVIG